MLTARHRKSCRSLAPVLGLSPALVDLFAIPLLIVASRSQCHFAEAPVVAQAAKSAARVDVQPLVVDLALDGPRVNDQHVSWEQLQLQIASLDKSQGLLLRPQTDQAGHGPMADLLRLSLMAQESQAADRLRVLTREPPES